MNDDDLIADEMFGVIDGFRAALTRCHAVSPRTDSRCMFAPSHEPDLPHSFEMPHVPIEAHWNSDARVMLDMARRLTLTNQENQVDTQPEVGVDNIPAVGQVWSNVKPSRKLPGFDETTHHVVTDASMASTFQVLQQTFGGRWTLLGYVVPSKDYIPKAEWENLAHIPKNHPGVAAGRKVVGSILIEATNFDRIPGQSDLADVMREGAASVTALLDDIEGGSS